MLARPHRSIFGRALEIRTIRRHLAGGARLIVVVGMGGIGKSALTGAVTDAERAGGRPVFRCAFDTAESIERLPDGLAAAMQVDLRSHRRADRVAHIGQALARLPAPLVVLDGFETLASAGRDVIAQWLEQAPDAAFLLSSRIWISLSAAVRIPLGPLPCAADVGDSPAVALFWQRAGRVRAIERTKQAKAAVEAIVRRLDGIPLAIELAAARAAVFDLPTLRRRIEDGAAVLSDPTGATAERQQTMDRTFEWSWRLLNPDAQAGLGQLTIFRGPFGLEDAEAVLAVDGATPADVLQQLIAASLLVEDPSTDGSPLAWRLLAPVRDAVRARAGTHPAGSPTAERYRRWFLDRASPDDLATLYDASDTWLDRVRQRRAEYEALSSGAWPPTVRLQATLRRIADPRLGAARDRVVELLDAALVAAPDTAPQRLRFAAQVARAVAGLYGARPAVFREAADEARRLGSRSTAADVQALLAYLEGMQASLTARFGDARTGLAAASRLARTANLPALAAFIDQNRIAIAGDGASGRRIGERTIAFARRAGSTIRFTQAASAMALILTEPDEQAHRIALLEAALATDRRRLAAGVRCSLIHRLAVVRHAQGALAASEQLYRRAAEWGAADQSPIARSYALGSLGLLALERQAPEEALAYFEDAVAPGAGGFARICQWCMALVHLERGDPAHLTTIPDDLPDTRGEPFYDVRSPLEAWTRIVRGSSGTDDPAPTALPDALRDGRVAPTVVILRRLGRLAWMRQHPPPDALLVTATRLRLPNEGWRSKGTSRIAGALLDALVDARLDDPGASCSPASLVRRVWPEEAAPDSASARNRLHVGLHKVRALGLRPWISRSDTGWHIDPALVVVRLPPNREA